VACTFSHLTCKSNNAIDRDTLIYLFFTALATRPAGPDSKGWRAANALTSFADSELAAAGPRRTERLADQDDNSLADLLCYSCLTLVKELPPKTGAPGGGGTAALPGYVALESEEERERRRQKSREETEKILREEGFLLDGEDDDVAVA
jgi:hypothetical protein